MLSLSFLASSSAGPLLTIAVKLDTSATTVVAMVMLVMMKLDAILGGHDSKKTLRGQTMKAGMRTKLSQPAVLNAGGVAMEEIMVAPAGMPHKLVFSSANVDKHGSS